MQAPRQCAGRHSRKRSIRRTRLPAPLEVLVSGLSRPVDVVSSLGSLLWLIETRDYSATVLAVNLSPRGCEMRLARAVAVVESKE